MKRLFSIDLGIRGVGVAKFDEGRFVAGAYLKNPHKTGAGPFECGQMALVVSGWLYEQSNPTWDVDLMFEWPRVYQRGGGRTKGDPNDLRALWAVGGGIAARCAPARSHSVEPATWKGQAPHEVIEARVKGRLDAAETDVYETALLKAGRTAGHNVTDAVGIGLFALGRFERSKVIHRRKDEP